jgi:hypothetical protein
MSELYSTLRWRRAVSCCTQLGTSCADKARVALVLAARPACDTTAVCESTRALQRCAQDSQGEHPGQRAVPANNRFKISPPPAHCWPAAAL